MDWVIGDIHGCYDEFMMLLSLIDFDKNVDRIFSVGDIIDRGPKILETVDWFVKGHEEGYAYIVKGNHEAMYADMILERDKEIYPDPQTKLQIPYERAVEIAMWIDNLPIMIESDDYFVTHAGMLSYKHLFHHTEGELLWVRDLTEIESVLRDGKQIIHGHTPMLYPIIREDRVNLDCGCVYGGKLIAYCPETEDLVWTKSMMEIPAVGNTYLSAVKHNAKSKEDDTEYGTEEKD